MRATDGTRGLVLVIVDGLTPAAFEGAVASGDAPAFAFLAENGRYRRGVSTFPSLTPVCLSTIATGAHPDVHGIPHLVWFDRARRRLVEYGSSLAAVLSAGAARSLRDTIFEMNERHLSRDAVTVYEALEDAGLTAAAINVTCYRGRTRHLPTIPGLARPAYGPRRFFYYSLFESDRTGAGLAVRNRAGGSVDRYAVAAGRWLVTRDGFDFLVYYLSDYDFASHAYGPQDARRALLQSDRAVGALMDAAGGWDEFLERYAVVLCSDHGQSRVEQAVRLEESFAGLRLFRSGGGTEAEVAVTASNRAGMIYRLPACVETVRELAERLDEEAGAETVLFLEGDEAVARREREELRFAPAPDGWRTAGDPAILDHPDALERAWAALNTPAAGEVIVSAATGVEFTDGGGAHHVGGGSHGSLSAEDSEVPIVTVGTDLGAVSITDLAPLALAHFGVEAPAYARSLERAA